MISILIATYNVEDVLENCLQSIFAQCDADWEVLIADGASTDGTLAIIDRHADRLAHHRSAPDDGTYDAWNSLLPHARGEWLMFLGADDMLHDDRTLQRLEQACAALEPRSPQLAFMIGRTELVADGEVIEQLGLNPLPDNRQPLSADFPFSHTGLLHHRDLFATFGNFETRFRIAADGHFMLRSARHPDTRFFHAGCAVARMAAGGLSTSARSRMQCYNEVEEARRLLEIEPACPGWLRALQLRSRIAYHISRIAGEGALLAAANAYRVLSGKSLRRSYR